MSNAQIFWACAAMLLIGVEVLMPGFFMLWMGIAAAGVFVLLLAGLPLSTLWQLIVFGLFSFVSVGVYWKFLRKLAPVSDQPLLNQKLEQMLGKQVTLETAIVHGEGRVKIGDAFWQVQGPDCPQGALVRVVSVDSGILRVLPAE